MSANDKEVIAWLSERKLMPSPELVNHISNHPEGIGLLERTVTSLTEPKLFLGISDLVEEEVIDAPKVIERKKVADIPPVIIERQIQKSMSDGKLESFVSLFNDRFKNLSKLVRREPFMRDAVRDTSNLSPDEENKIIGMVADIQTFNNGRTRVTLEDRGGRINVMLQESSEENLNLIMDEVIGVSGKLSRQGNVLFVNSPIVRPHLGRYREVSRAEEPHIALFISDVHLGSGTFQEKVWD